MIILSTILGIVFGFALCLICNPKIYAYFDGIHKDMVAMKIEIQKIEVMDEKALLEILEELKNRNIL